MSFALRSRPTPEPVGRYVWGELPDGKAVTAVEHVVLAGNTWEERHAAVTGFLARQDLAGHRCVRLVVQEEPPAGTAPDGPAGAAGAAEAAVAPQRKAARKGAASQTSRPSRRRT
ncbi:hypothetical protein [Motilibacter deserti]|uniref:BON domain-containing protein n=1 Tax=Motilibacter deserti TaxID=2714956 RepID=A0ABX0GRG1_9ACTN|nr:hypothetical protein [Motilibacter deserti]NHC13327.1 hypothetical protein [Motilibacter deserti]